MVADQGEEGNREDAKSARSRVTTGEVMEVERRPREWETDERQGRSLTRNVVSSAPIFREEPVSTGPLEFWPARTPYCCTTISLRRPKATRWCHHGSGAAPASLSLSLRRAYRAWVSRRSPERLISKEFYLASLVNQRLSKTVQKTRREVGISHESFNNLFGPDICAFREIFCEKARV